MLDTMAKNKPDLVATAPVLNDFAPERLHRKHELAYHPGALKYFRDNKLEANAYE
jgi:hypothetical protein